MTGFRHSGFILKNMRVVFKQINIFTCLINRLPDSNPHINEASKIQYPACALCYSYRLYCYFMCISANSAAVIP